MAKSLDDVMTEVRFLISDTGASGLPERYTDTQLVMHLNTALRDLYTLRPDAFIGSQDNIGISETAMPTFTTGDLNQTPATAFPVDDRLFYTPVVVYMVGKIELADDEFTDQSRSTALLQAFKASLQGM